MRFIYIIHVELICSSFTAHSNIIISEEKKTTSMLFPHFPDGPGGGLHQHPGAAVTRRRGQRGVQVQRRDRW